MSILTKEEMNELLIRVRNGDNIAKEILVEKNLGLVWSIVKRFKGRGYEQEELFQTGCIGLIKSIDKFDLSYGVNFSTYAVPMIMGEIKRFVRDDGIIRVSRSLKEQNIKLIKAIDELTKKLSRNPSINEISEYTNIEIEEIVMCQEACSAPESLYKYSSSENKEICILDMVNGNKKNENDIIEGLDLKKKLSKLSARERQIIVLRYYKEETQQAIAEKLGISQVQVSRLENKILKKLKEQMI